MPGAFSLPKKYFHIIVAISLLVAVSLFSVLMPEVGTASADSVRNLTSGMWSDAAIWEGGRVPTDGAAVKISEGTDVIYDQESYSEIGKLEIFGKLSFIRTSSTNLDVGTITVHPEGTLEIGTSQAPIPRDVHASIRIVNERDGQNGLEVMGELQLHGSPLGKVYTHLSVDAKPGHTSLVVKDEVDWNRGDLIVLASTSKLPGDTELNRIDEIAGNTITLMWPVRNWHSGSAETQAELANLTRNVLITSKNPELRGHTRYLAGSHVEISYVEFSKLGAKNQMGKYPVHFHMAGDSMKGSYVKGASIWDSGNRFLTVHSTSSVRLSDNVGYDAVGHGFFMEGGDEVLVTWERNIGMSVKPGKLIPSDKMPSIFWSQNPMNAYIDNVAIGSGKGNGFDFRLPSGSLDIPQLGGMTYMKNLTFLKFSGNVAHSNFRDGLKIYPANIVQPNDSNLFNGMKLWRNGMIGAHIVSHGVTVENASAFGNGTVNVVMKGKNNTLSKSKIVGEVVAPGSADANAISATPRGVMFEGEGSQIIGSTLRGHHSNISHSGADVSIFQDAHHTGTTLTITDVVMESPRDVLFGYPFNGKSFIKIEGYKGVTGADLLLFRLDGEPPEKCEFTLDMKFIAKVCMLVKEDNQTMGFGFSTERFPMLRPWMPVGFRNLGFIASVN